VLKAADHCCKTIAYWPKNYTMVKDTVLLAKQLDFSLA